MKIQGRETQMGRETQPLQVIGRSLFSLLVLIVIGGCQGDRIASGWFAPDPQLEQPASEPSPTPTPSPIQAPTGDNPEGTLPPAPDGDTEAADETRLPATFPTDVPSYPQSQLLAASYRAGQGTGSTDWKSQASPKKIASFYQQFLTDKGWKLEQKFSEDKPETVLLTEPHELRITFPNEGMFRIAYRDTSITPQTAGTSSQPTVGVASGQVVGDLQALNAIPADFDPEAVINRRTFARWLLTAHNQMYRDRATKQIRPATSSSQPAFQDIPASDPDFATIQGLAEAGIIPSRLTGATDALLFQPDAPLTRETLIAWKVPLDRRTALPAASVQNIQQVWGFQDVAKIAPGVLPALLVDYENGDRANVLRVFGYTKLFQPKKPVTQSEATIAIWSFGFQGEGITAAQSLQMGG